MIDYMQLMRSGDAVTRTDEVARASAAVAELAKEVDVAVIALAQLNRGVAGADGSLRRPVLSDLRDSGTIEQDATAVLLLHTEPMRGDSAVGGGAHNTEIIIAKARHWPVRQGHVIEMEQDGLRWVPRDGRATTPSTPTSKLLLPEAAKAA
ncbi:replicative DNA helicase, partial [mine drainage metagenome]